MFLHPALLWALGLMSVPIIIHLLNRRRFTVVRWAAMDFLLQAQKKNRRRVRIEHLLVLLLRCLVMALIALAVSRPVATSGAFAGLPGVGDPVERIFLLDDSGSMSHRTGRTSAWDRARQVVKRLVEDLEREDKSDLVTIVRASRLDVPDLLQSSARHDRTKSVLAALAEAEPAPLRLDAVRLIERAARRIVDDTQGPRQRVVYLVTDLRRRDWLGEHGDVPKAIGEAMKKAPPDVRWMLVDVGGEETRNLGITALEPTEKLAMIGVPLEVVIRVANRGPSPVFDVPLMLEAGESRIPLPPLQRIDAGQEAEVRYRYTFTTPGVHSLTVRLPDDALGLDDVRHVALEVRERLRVLLVQGDEGDQGALSGATDLLRLALAPPGDVLTGVEPIVIAADALREVDLAAYDAVVACNLEAWPAEKVPDLERWVHRGGGLALFLGDAVDADAWGRDLHRGGRGLLPCALGRRIELATEEEAPQIAAPTGEHPLTHIFGGDRNPFLKRVRARVRHACPVAAEQDPATRVLLRLVDPGSTPFLIEKQWGEGRVVLLNTTADLTWSGWPRDPSFIVTSQELVRLLAPAATAGRNLACGEPLERAINPARVWPRAKVDVPGQDAPTELHAEPRAGSDALFFSLPETRRAGVYVLRLEPRSSEPEREAFAVNPDPAEGDLPRAEEPQVLAPLTGLPVRLVKPDAEGELLAASDGTRTELWRLCLLLLTAALALEQVLAWRAAHHLRAESPAEVAA